MPVAQKPLIISLVLVQYLEKFKVMLLKRAIEKEQCNDILVSFQFPTFLMKDFKEVTPTQMSSF